MSRTRQRANTKGTKAQRDAYQKWRRESGMRDDEAERKVVVAARQKTTIKGVK
jgi:hypothetical protein